MAYIYDIVLDKLKDGACVGNSGDEIFDTKEEALADADDYILSHLADEYKARPSEFNVVIYEPFIY